MRRKRSSYAKVMASQSFLPKLVPRQKNCQICAAAELGSRVTFRALFYRSDEQKTDSFSSRVRAALPRQRKLGFLDAAQHLFVLFCFVLLFSMIGNDSDFIGITRNAAEFRRKVKTLVYWQTKGRQ